MQDIKEAQRWVARIIQKLAKLQQFLAELDEATSREVVPTMPATASESQRTEFPWQCVSMRVRDPLFAVRGDEPFPAWPWSCEDLFLVGCKRLLALDGFGHAAAWEINQELERLGFRNWGAT